MSTVARYTAMYSALSSISSVNSQVDSTKVNFYLNSGGVNFDENGREMYVFGGESKRPTQP